MLWGWLSVHLQPILSDNCAYLSKVLICLKDMSDQSHLSIYKVGYNAASNNNRSFEASLVLLIRVLHDQTFLTWLQFLQPRFAFSVQYQNTLIGITINKVAIFYFRQHYTIDQIFKHFSGHTLSNRLQLSKFTNTSFQSLSTCGSMKNAGQTSLLD